MRKLILILAIFCMASTIYAHKQAVHQYITTEGYHLLRNYFGSDIPQMGIHLDNGSVGPAWQNGTLTAGAWREDEEDIVYGYKDFVQLDGALKSISHFWDAD